VPVLRKAALVYSNVERDPDCCNTCYRNCNLVHGGYFRLRQSHVAGFGERPIMRIMHITTAVVWALTLLLLAPLEAKAGTPGGGMRTYHVGGQHVVRGQHIVRGRHALARHHFRSVRNQAFGLSPYGYGYYDEPPYTYNDSMTYQMPETAVVRPEPPQVRCQHSEQTRKVPSANGGTTEVTILRC
jgi:hypothetical protein